jgi:hypothetical protein
VCLQIDDKLAVAAVLSETVLVCCSYGDLERRERHGKHPWSRLPYTLSVMNAPAMDTPTFTS